MQLGDLAGHDDAAAATEDLDVLAATRLQQVDHVLEELDVATLVRGDGDSLHILLQRRVDDLLHRTVVAEMDDLGTGPCRMRRMMLIDASCPSNSEAAVTKRSLCLGLYGRSFLAIERSVMSVGAPGKLKGSRCREFHGDIHGRNLTAIKPLPDTP
jgi:hypothetical protein